MGFFDGGARSLSFGNMNDQTWLNRWRGGVIVDIREEKQQTHFQTKAPLWSDVAQTVPKMELPMVLRCDGQGPAGIAAGMPAGLTDERTDPTDDGRRTLYVKGTLRFDIGNKLREVDADTNNLIGGELYFRQTGTRQTDNGTGRTWEVLYFPPPAGANAGSFFAQEQQAPPAQQGIVVGQVQGFNPGAGAQQPAQPQQQAAPASSPFGAAPAAQQAPQAPAQGSPFGAAPAAPAQVPSNNPFGA